MTEPEKQCRKCLAFKPLGDFCNDKSRKDGKMPACKYCKREYARKYRAANREKINESQRQSRAANPEKINEARRKRYAANPEKINEYQRKRRTANPEKYNESQRQYYAANPERCNEATRKCRTARRHARNQCAVFNALDPKKWERLESKLKALNPLRT